MGKVLVLRSKIKTFEYEGDQFGIRPATVKEMQTITQLMSDYQKSLKAELISDKANDIVEESTNRAGDLTLMSKVHTFILQNLLVDPKTKEKIEVPDTDNVDSDFVREAWFCYAGMTERRYLGKRLVDVFGQEFVDRNSSVDSSVVDLELNRLDNIDAAQAHQARVKLDLVKPGSEAQSEKDPTPPATTTLHSVEPSSPLPNSSISTPKPLDDGTT